MFSKDGLPVPWSPSKRKVDDVLDAMQSVALLDRDIEQPVWLDANDQNVVDTQRSADGIVSCSNGLIDVLSGKRFEHTPRFFNLVSVPFAFDPQAPTPRRWLKFLAEVWPQPQPAPGHAVPEIAPEIDVLGEWFGYVISGRTDLHKMMLTVGPTRSGKGVIARVLESLIGKANVAAPTASSLSGEFGLAPLIGKPLAIVADARLGKKSADSRIVERLLTLAGGDPTTVNIKHREQWTGHLPTRLHLISNELPKFEDASSAIVGRFIILITQQSWLGKEDRELEGEIAQELTGIFNWALAGLHRLAANKWCFTNTPSADEAIMMMHDLASPIRVFVRECCELHKDHRAPRDLLYGSYKIWSENNGHPVEAASVFGRDLRAAFPVISDVQPRDASGKQYRAYRGITLRSADRG
jgi:putative DNA primase/helicase